MGKSRERRSTRVARDGNGSSSVSESDAQAAGHRHARLVSVIRQELAALIRDEVRDPALDGVVVISVDLSVDYRAARVRYALVPLRDPAAIAHAQAALGRASGFLRARLADAMGTKFVPSLRFVFDREAGECTE